jgi:outer membrane protein insertion porin family
VHHRHGNHYPLRLSYAQPLNARPTDRIQKLQFTFGTGF